MLVTKGPTSQNWWEYHEPGVLPRSGHKRRRRVPGKNWKIYDTWPSILEFCTAKSFPIGMAPAHLLGGTSIPKNGILSRGNWRHR